jgi:hypothetical protein
VDYSYNAFTNSSWGFPVGGTSNIIVTSGFNWQTSWLGSFYLPPGSSNLNAGDASATNYGLYHFTTRTNQVTQGDATVDIGYHYVATDAFGNPLVSNTNGVPDYLADANGNGRVDPGEIPWTNPPIAFTVPASGDVTLSVPVPFSSAFNYHWQLDGTNLAWATGAALTVTNAQLTNAGAYTVVITNAAGAMYTASAILTAGKDIYVSQGGAGGSNGTDRADPYSLAWLNNSANWGTCDTSQINPGDTIHLLGVITTNILIQGSGIPGYPITLYFEPDAMCSAPTLGTTAPYNYWIYADGRHDLVIDGGLNGLLQCTSNGTPASYLMCKTNNGIVTTNYGTSPFQNFVCGIHAAGNGVNNFTVRNLTISNLYNRLPSSDDPGSAGSSGNSIAIALSGNNILIENNTIYNSQDGIDYTFGGDTTSSNLTIVGNTLIGWNHGINPGTSGTNVSPILYNVLISGNRLDGMDVYEDAYGTNGTYEYHRDGIFFVNECYTNNPSHTNSNAEYPTNFPGTPAGYYFGLCSNVDISGNFIGPGLNPQTTNAGTAAIFIDDYSTDQYADLRIYNNILTLKAPLLEWANGYIAGGFGVNTLIANNTLVGWTNSTGSSVGYNCIQGGGPGCLILNNLQYHCLGGVTLLAQDLPNNPNGDTTILSTSDTNNFAGCYSDYNIFSVASGADNFEYQMLLNWGNTGYLGYLLYSTNSLAAWQSLAVNFDPHSTTNIPVMNPAYPWIPLRSDTIAQGNGTNLSTIFSTDFYGNERAGGTTNWTIGAAVYATNAAAPVMLAQTSYYGLGIGAQDTNPVAWYKFDEGTGYVAHDSSGNGCDITFTGNSWTTSGNETTNYAVVGTSDMTSMIANSPCLGSSWTVSVWLWPDSTSTGAYEAIWSTASAGVYYHHNSMGSHIDFYSGSDHMNTSVITENQWIYATVVNNNGNVTFYTNGVADGFYSGAGTSFTATSVLGNGSDQDFIGYMDDLRIYSYALSSNLVSTIYTDR